MNVIQPSDVPSTVSCEYLVIGSGAGGSVAALELAEAGKDVVILEEGLYHDTKSFSRNVGDMTRKLYRQGGISPFWGKPAIGFAEGRCVGGTTVINGGLLWRTPERILESWKKNEGLQGYDPENLKKHFIKIETLLNVSPPKTGDGLNLDSEIIQKACKALGWKYVPAPRAVNNCVNTNQCATGCPTGAKQSTALSYLPKAISKGARILTGCRANSLQSKGKGIITSAVTPSAQRVTIRSKYLFLASGPIQSPFLLQKNRLSPIAGEKLRFHLNFKIVAEFPHEIHADRGTIFTGQVQQFENEGILMMASNFNPAYIASTLSHYPDNTLNEVFSKLPCHAMYVTQIQSKSHGRVHSCFQDAPFVTYDFAEADLDLLKKGYEHTARMLFAAGAKTLYPPIKGVQPARNFQDVKNQIDHLTPSQLELISVHAMSSCPMSGSGTGVVDLEGKLKGYENIFLCDASILPSNIGESPQGTIMAMAHEILTRHLANS